MYIHCIIQSLYCSCLDMLAFIIIRQNTYTISALLALVMHQKYFLKADFKLNLLYTKSIFKTNT